MNSKLPNSHFQIQISLAVLKFIYSEKATKNLRNLPLTFDYSTYGQKLGEDFAKFWGLLKIYELYKKSPPQEFIKRTLVVG